MAIEKLIQDPLFGIILTLGTYILGRFLYDKKKTAIFHPVLISIVLIIVFLTTFDIEYEVYNNGGKYISFLLGPATVALAIPMYRKLELLKENLLVILLSTLLSSLIAIILVVTMGLILDADVMLILSMIPKSVTTPIAVEISRQIGGVRALTAGIVIITGLMGGMFGPALNNLFKVQSTMSRGLSMGITAHGIGTARALEESQEEGALSGLSICLVGFFTAISAPAIINILKYFSII